MNTQMSRLSSVRLGVILGFTLLCAYPVINWAPRLATYEFLNCVIVLGLLGTFAGYAPSGYRALKLPSHLVTAAQMANVSWCFGSLGGAFIFAHLWVWRELGKPEGMEDHWFGILGRWLFSMAVVMALTTVGSEAGKLPIATYRRATMYVLLALLTAVVLVAFRVRMNPLQLHWWQ